ncbi:putative ERAD-associated E3 ubiquitin-protein ligase HRD1-like [Capsicum annuum]|nr:putative ERAD-associated E3 ubiquitin-protein ligase HRD1-like [Capsicum annuum]KAF3647057.1 putative ERAD-associated E3 ubiquitin-protein ligase HRD1-like [Capsicum annuum]
MLPTNFVYHDCFSNSFVHVKISEQKRLIDVPQIDSSCISIDFYFKIQKRFWYTGPNDQESVPVHSTRQGSITGLYQIFLLLSDIMLYERLDCAISGVLWNRKDEFEGQHAAIIEYITRRLGRTMTAKKSNYKFRDQVLEICVDVKLVIDHVCKGKILFASEELSEEMMPASKSSMQFLHKVEVDERNVKNECMVCLDEIGKECEVLCMPCSHMFHNQCITKWLEESHYCPLCLFEIPTE